MRERKILRKKITRCFHQASTFDGIFAAWLPFFKHMLYHLNIYIKRLPGKGEENERTCSAIVVQQYTKCHYNEN